MIDFKNHLAEYVDMGFEPVMDKAYLNIQNLQNNLDDIQKQTKKLSIFEQFQKNSQDIKSNFPKISVNTDMTLPELLDQEGVHYKITSAYRPNSKTKQGRKSNHSVKNGAYDIKPADGYSWDDLKREIYSNKNIRMWMEKKGWGIIDETNPSTMKQTGATGPHWHFGPDTLAVKQWNDNVIRYGQNGFKFEDNLSQTIPTNVNNKTSILQYLDDIESQLDDDDDDDENPFTKKIETPDDALFPIIKPKIPKMKEDKKETKYTGNIPNLIHEMIPDQQKADILTSIAYQESRFNPNAKNPTSSASGLFQQTNANKQKYGYGDVRTQINAASKMYDDGLKEINKLTSKYGNRGKTLKQLMYAYWFRPASLRNFLINGNDSYSDAQGTNINKIMSKV